MLFHTGTKNQAIQKSHSSSHSTCKQTKNVAMLPPSQLNSVQSFYHQHHPAQQTMSPSHYTERYVYGNQFSSTEHLQYQPQLPQSGFCVPVSRNDNITTNGFHLTNHNYSAQQQQQPRVINYSNKMSSEQLSRADHLSDLNIPVNSPIIWELSQEVKEWKFLARNLDLEERVIEEIDQYTKPNKMRDKSLRVFTEWVNSSSRPSWKALGEALLEAEYVFLYEKLLELLKRYAV